MEVKKKTMYAIVFWTWATLTVVSYVWGLISLIRWIVNLF